MQRYIVFGIIEILRPSLSAYLIHTRFVIILDFLIQELGIIFFGRYYRCVPHKGTESVYGQAFVDGKDGKGVALLMCGNPSLLGLYPRIFDR